MRYDHDDKDDDNDDNDHDHYHHRDDNGDLCSHNGDSSISGYFANHQCLWSLPRLTFLLLKLLLSRYQSNSSICC